HAVDLVLGEFLLRRQLGEAPDLDEYCRRFPHFAEQLHLQVGLYDAWPVSAQAETRLAPVGDLSESVVLRAAGLGGFDSDYRSSRRLWRAIARDRSAGTLLPLIVRRLAERPHVALARVWLVRPGDQCASCPARPECPDQTACLHLAASAGRPLHEEGDWSRLDGRARRVPLGGREGGLVAPGRQPIRGPALAPGAPRLAAPRGA